MSRGRKLNFRMIYGKHESFPVDEAESYWNMPGRNKFKRRKPWIKHADTASVLCLKEDCDQNTWERRILYNHWGSHHHKRNHDGEDKEYVVVSHFSVSDVEGEDENGEPIKMQEYGTEYRLVSISSPLRQIPPSLVNIFLYSLYLYFKSQMNKYMIHCHGFIHLIFGGLYCH